MPLVFLHGVNNRREIQEQAFDKMVAVRSELFKKMGFHSISGDTDRIKVFNPYWGNLGAKFAWNLSSLPERGVEQFGPEDETYMVQLSAAIGEMSPDDEVDPDIILTNVAKRSLNEAIDLLWAGSAEHMQETKDAVGLAALAAQTLEYALQNPNPSWLDDVRDDGQFIDELSRAVSTWHPDGNILNETEAEGMETFGADEIWVPIRAARARLQQVSQGLLPQSLLDSTRRKLTEFMGRFIGDIFVYLGNRGTKAKPGPIVQEVIKYLDLAAASVDDNDKYLILVGHSLGGDILYDVLTYYRPDIHADLFLTVGSQVALFEELKLFHSSNKRLPDKEISHIAKVDNIHHWMNIYDLNDMLAFSAAGIFDGVIDHEFSTGKGLIWSHSSYFSTPTFHQRLAVRLKEVFL